MITAKALEENDTREPEPLFSVSWARRHQSD
jgi:hypothetical protein